jgi:bifunctional DNA primase/polymerase-like protein
MLAHPTGNSPDTHHTADTHGTPAPTVDDALALAHVGMPIIPLKPSTKEPRFNGWKMLYSIDPTVIAGWWRQCPGANIGYVIPRGVLVIDVDPRHGGDVGWNNLCARHGELPTTWRVWTGRQDGGFHLSFTMSDEVLLPEATDIDQGVQVLGHRHLVVLPPSLHPDTGKAYAWDEVTNPFTMPTPAPAPDWLIALTLETAQRHAPKKKWGDTRAMRAAEIAPEHHEFGGEWGSRPPGDNCIAAGEPGVPPPRPTSGSPSGHPPPKGYGSRAAALLRDPASIPAKIKALNYPENLQDGMSVPCPCSEHTHGDQSPSGVWREPHGKTLDYGVWCFKAQKFYTVNELFYFMEGGGLIPLRAEVDADGTRHEHRRAFLLWGLRLLERARLMMVPKEWGYPMLPPSAPEDSRILWPVILDVKRFRNATEQGSKEPLPLSYNFLRDWSPAVRHWSHKRMQAAFVWLVSKRFLEKAGEYWHGCKKTLLWCVGERHRRQARKDAPVESTIDKAVESMEATPAPAHVAHSGHAWSAAGPPTVRSCPLAVDDPDHDEATCVIWQAWLKTEAKKRLYGSPPLVELPPVDWEAFYAP